jgi:hypothetical protein
MKTSPMKKATRAAVMIVRLFEERDLIDGLPWEMAMDARKVRRFLLAPPPPYQPIRITIAQVETLLQELTEDGFLKVVPVNTTARVPVHLAPQPVAAPSATRCYLPPDQVRWCSILCPKCNVRTLASVTVIAECLRCWTPILKPPAELPLREWIRATRGRRTRSGWRARKLRECERPWRGQCGFCGGIGTMVACTELRCETCDERFDPWNEAVPELPAQCLGSTPVEQEPWHGLTGDALEAYLRMMLEAPSRPSWMPPPWYPR